MNWFFWKSKPTQNLETVVKDPLSEVSDEALSLRVLDEIFPILNPGDKNYLSVSMSHNYDIENWRPRLNKQQEAINQVAQWVQSVTDNRIRNEYIGWIKHYQRNLDSAWSELKTQDNKNSMGDYNQRNKKLREQVNSIGDIPSPRNITRN